MSGWGDTAGKIFWIGMGGFLGANARYWLAYWVQQRLGSTFPWGTFIVNMTGSFILGFIATLLLQRTSLPHAQTLRLAIAVGFVGAYTTFSTLEYDTFTLAQSRLLLQAFGNAVGSLIVGLFAVWLGVVVGRIS